MRSVRWVSVLVAVVLACGGGGDDQSGDDAGAGTGDAGGSAIDAGDGEGLLAEDYPGDVGIDGDPAVVWAENFEEGSVAAVTDRYDSSQNAAGMALVGNVPAGSSGLASMRMTSSGAGPNATDLYKNLGTGYDELYIRYYVRYEAGVNWHHSGMWVGGYNPPSNWPNPQAGLKPDGDDRFSVAFEPTSNGPNARLDFYNYWMTMHSWMDEPSGSTAYYGNALIHDTSVRAPDDAWLCVELRIRLNPNPSSGAGAQLGVWIDDASVQQFTDSAPLGYWIKDKFCPDDADGPECTDYRPSDPTLVPLDLQYRSTSDLRLNAFWPQNYITEGGAGSLWLDDIVVATRRIGCLR